MKINISSKIMVYIALHLTATSPCVSISQGTVTDALAPRHYRRHCVVEGHNRILCVIMLISWKHIYMYAYHRHINRQNAALPLYNFVNRDEVCRFLAYSLCNYICVTARVAWIACLFIFAEMRINDTLYDEQVLLALNWGINTDLFPNFRLQTPGIYELQLW